MSVIAGRRHRKRKLKAEINVVPYIDVMLVLLVIFMITAPLLNLGVDIDLPQSRAKSINAKTEPVVVQVYPDGSYALTVKGDQAPQSMSAEALAARVGAFHRQNPAAPVLVAGEGAAKYQHVMDAIDLLRGAGVEKVSLLTDQKQGGR
ncbi:protein TolR [Lysobacter cavernae]|uniref:Tol-Pal system protein TolR n=1 Tax=Lysobacter cavernae TaxID=1685901 RepID=A0ABV7RPQ6_9GAMM